MRRCDLNMSRCAPGSAKQSQFKRFCALERLTHTYTHMHTYTHTYGTYLYLKYMLAVVLAIRRCSRPSRKLSTHVLKQKQKQCHKNRMKSCQSPLPHKRICGQIGAARRVAYSFDCQHACAQSKVF